MPNDVSPIRILLVDDHLLVREGIKKLLEGVADFEIVGEAENGRRAVTMTQRLLPDVVLMDVAMPRLNGIEATRQLMRANPKTKVIIVSAHSDEAYVAQVNAAGASGYLVKQSSFDMVAKAIRTVMAGETFFGPHAPDRAGGASAEADQQEPREGLARLTSRERELLQLIAEGFANKQSADELGISMKTVEKHRSTLMSKLGIHDVATLTRYAVSAGIVESSVQLTYKRGAVTRDSA